MPSLKVYEASSATRCMQKLAIVAILLVVLVCGCTGQGVQQGTQSQTLITTAPADMMPTRADISSKKSTEFTIDGGVQDATLAAAGFEGGKTMSTSKLEGSMGLITVDYTVYKFDTAENAKAWYDSRIGEIQANGGYKEVSISGCFGWKEDFGMQGEDGSSICLTRNVVYVVGGNAAQTYVSIDSFMRDGTALMKTKVV